MIVSFRDKDTAQFFSGADVARFRAFAGQASRRLQILDSATTTQDLAALRSNRFEALKGDRKGQYSIRINQQWRICFTFRNGEAHDVEIVDYH
ncbi:MAG: type II toxin-antitoxin system RelE/ParE family toxin [Rhodospirillaceae bacterium]|nr:type II toxin-antitoxin system RelE/ParE family toxin [Rhodospirillaceae bacterium]